MNEEERKAWDIYAEMSAKRLLDTVFSMTDKWQFYIAKDSADFADAMIEQRKARMG